MDDHPPHRPGSHPTAASPGRGRRRRIEDALAGPMFWLGFVFLIIVAAVIYLIRGSDQTPWDWLPIRIAVGSLLVLWPIFLAEAVVRFLLSRPAERNAKSLVLCLTAGLIPPLRMATHSRTRVGDLWLPWLGWQRLDFDLQKTLERAFSGPMLCMALLILPVLAIEYFWSEAVASNPLLRTVLGVGVAVIWIAFATEFIIRCSAAEKKPSYAFNHWVDLAVVLLPMVEFIPFLRVLRVTRLMRLERMARIAKYYRLYGVAGKGWRGLVVLQLVQQMFSRSPRARVSRLKGRLEDKQDEIEELEREVDYYRRQIRSAEQELAESEPTQP